MFRYNILNFAKIAFSMILSVPAIAEVQALVCTSDYRGLDGDAVQIRVIRSAESLEGGEPLYDISYAQTISENVDVSKLHGSLLLGGVKCKFKTNDTRLARCDEAIAFADHQPYVFTTSKIVTETFEPTETEQMKVSISNRNFGDIPDAIRARLHDSETPYDISLKFFVNLDGRNIGGNCVVTNSN